MSRVLIRSEDLAATFFEWQVLDARAGADAQARFDAAHIPGSIRVDADRDLAAHTENAAHGGRHPLPSVETFAQTMARLRVDASAPIAVVDDQGGANAAARLTWMLRSAGVKNVRLVDGGVPALLPLVKGKTPRAISSTPLTISATEWQAPLASLGEVNARRLDPRWRVVDVRSAVRFRGEQEPIDPIAGHIPGAINLPFSDNLDANGRFRSSADLRAYFEDRLGVPMDHVIVHCGSGVTACHTLLALDEAGLSGAALYVGSWSEWCRHPELPRDPQR